jgi:CRISPR/Cas system-associated exonuclease Cas4 (RecB family)
MYSYVCATRFDVYLHAQNVLRAETSIATGKTLFSILFHLIDEFISAVDAYQDGWSHTGPVERCSWVMTLVEEANDSSTDKRSVLAVRAAEAHLRRFDAVMALAVKRFKSECTEYWELSKAIGRKQETLARSCCLLSEQTGFGDADDMG